jgi:CRISPR-associated protein Cas2
MAIHQPKLYLLAYDIGEPARLQRVHRTVREVGLPLQYSVFLVPGDAVVIDSLLQELASIIDDRDDDIRVYPLPARLESERFGRQQLPFGLDLVPGDSLHDGLLALIGEPEEGMIP